MVVATTTVDVVDTAVDMAVDTAVAGVHLFVIHAQDILLLMGVYHQEHFIGEISDFNPA